MARLLFIGDVRRLVGRQFPRDPQLCLSRDSAATHTCKFGPRRCDASTQFLSEGYVISSFPISIPRICAVLTALFATSVYAATIADIKAASDGTVFTGITGIVTTVGGNSGRLQFTLEDATGAIVVDKGTATYTQPAVGDEVTISSAARATFSGLIEFSLTTGANVMVNTSNQTLPDPVVYSNIVTFLGGDASALQGKRVRLNNVSISTLPASGGGSTTWLAAATLGNVNYTISDNFSNTITLRFPNDLNGKAPSWQAKTRPVLSTERFDVIGAVFGTGSTLQVILTNPSGSSAVSDPAGPIIEPPTTTGGGGGGSSIFSKNSATDVRIVAWNTEKFLMDTSKTAIYTRMLTALQPDIISFEEVVDSYSATAIRARLNTLMPLPGGASWTVNLGVSDGFNRNVVASKWSQSLQITNVTPHPSTQLRGVTGALVDLPDATYTKDVYVMANHFKCCLTSGNPETATRQEAADSVANWFMDIRTVGGAITLANGTPVLSVGDFNTLDGDDPAIGPDRTIIRGEIVNTGTYGLGGKPDWDNTNLTDLKPVDLASPSERDTWSTSDPTPTSRLDRIYYTDSAAPVSKSFVFNSKTLSAPQLSAAGLLSTDCANAADHYPIAVDLAVPLVPNAGVDHSLVDYP